MLWHFVLRDWLNLTGWDPPSETDFDALRFTNPYGRSRNSRGLMPRSRLKAVLKANGSR